MSGLNSKYPLAIVADAPKDLLKLQGALAQPNHSRGRGPEHGNYRGVSASEQPQLGRAVRRAKCEWAWERGGGELSGVALTYLSVFPGLHLLPPCRAPGLLPPSDGSPRLGDPTAAGEHFQGPRIPCTWPGHPLCPGAAGSFGGPYRGPCPSGSFGATPLRGHSHLLGPTSRG